jgi:tRNA 2-thiocytidine biosynthesis protein TtcA
VKALLAELEQKNPYLRANIFASLANVRPTHLFDTELRKQLGLSEAAEAAEAPAAANGAELIPLLALARSSDRLI